jgi:hypothetical protein
MYLALQSLPTGSGRTNVGIYYKELTDYTDMNSVANFSTDWNGFYQVSNTSSAYSSLDLQADDRIGFIYEETLTGWGKRNNPVSTSFPNGEGQHNFDGFDNIYVAYDLDYITGGTYVVNRNVSRGAFVKNYLNAMIDASSVSAATKADAKKAVEALSDNPTTAEVDKVYGVLAGEPLADPWDGKVVTFTNVQQNGKEYALYINDQNVLSISNDPVEYLGDAAKFVCKKENSGKYSLYNEASNSYMIWRAGNNYGYNNNAGTLSTYNATYCDWSINDASGTVPGTYYITSKRANGTTDGTLILLSSGVFDAWSSGVGYASNYSNLFRIEATVPTAIESVSAKRDGKVYDLSGRQVAHPTRGIYIIDGRKVYIK